MAMIKIKKDVVIAIIAVVLAALCLLAVFLAFFSGSDRGEPPVIYGVRESIVLYMDDDIQAALIGGVYAADREGNTFPVEATLYDQSGKKVTEYQPGTYRLVYHCKSAQEVESLLVLHPEDKEPPVIAGARDLTVTVGGTVSYRNGVTVTDNADENVQLQVDAGQVNLSQAGSYPVTYWAEDSRGNRTEVTITVRVEEAPAQGQPGVEPTTDPTEPAAVTREALDELAAGILSQITTPNMTQRQKARAIFDYVSGNVHYVGTPDSVDWVTAAYVGLTQKRGDCFYYFACSKELLTLAGIPNIDLNRVGGNSDHYWQLVNVGDGWYHFDACPHPDSYPLTAFLLTEAEVREYSTLFTGIWLNYYMYDYDACPVTVVGTPGDEGQQPGPSASEALSEEQPPEEETSDETPEEQLPEEASPETEPEQPDSAAGQETGVTSGEETA